MPSLPARSLNDKVFSLEGKLEKEQQELKAGQASSSLHLGIMWWEGMEGTRLGPLYCLHYPSVYVPGYSEMLLRVQQLTKDLNSLNCQMATLKNNGERCAGECLAPFSAQVPLGSISDPLPSDLPQPPPLRNSKYLLCC